MIKRWMYVTLFPAFISAYTNPIDCDFEKDSCSWSIDGFRRISYNQFNGTDRWNNHTHRNGKEWYLYFDATNVSYATLESIQATIQGLQCLNFWYRVSAYDESQIQVIVHDIGGGNDSTIWEKSYIYDTGWNLASVEIDVQYSTLVTIHIRGRTGRSYSKIGIDDVVVKLASCLEFNYTVTECKPPRNHSVLSSALEIYPGEKCLSFEYQTKDFQRKKIYIDVQSYHKNQWSTVWKGGYQEQFEGWKEISANINLGNKSRIAIRFAHENCVNATYYISSISLKKEFCTESTKSPTTISSSPNGKVNYSANDGVIIGIVIGCLALTVAMLLVAIYLYRRRRATSPGANIFKNSTVSGGTCSEASSTINENGETRHSTERLNQTSETVPYNAQAQGQLLDKDGNNVTNPVQTHGQYHQSADKEGTNSYDTMRNTYNHTKEFRNDTYDSTIIYPKTILNTTYDHTNVTRNLDNICDQTNLIQVRKRDTTLQRSMQDLDPTYDHT